MIIKGTTPNYILNIKCANILNINLLTDLHFQQLANSIYSINTSLPFP